MSSQSTESPDGGRSRVLIVLGVSLVLAVLVIGIAARSTWQQDGPDPPAAEAGADIAAPADCDPVRSRPAEDNSHVDDRALEYPAPPAAGDHSGRWQVLSRSFYVEADRPEVSVLVHNLEHGYNILWYDQTVLDDPATLREVALIADGYAGSRRVPADAFIAAPWTAADGPVMPAGAHYALTHWYADPEDRTRSRADEVGYTMYCRTMTAHAVRQWMRRYPLRDAPEGYRINM